MSLSGLHPRLSFSCEWSRQSDYWTAGTFCVSTRTSSTRALRTACWPSRRIWIVRSSSSARSAWSTASSSRWVPVTVRGYRVAKLLNFCVQPFFLCSVLRAPCSVLLMLYVYPACQRFQLYVESLLIPTFADHAALLSGRWAQVDGTW